MQEFIQKIYSEYEDDLDMFGFNPNECDDIETKSYVYAWYVTSDIKRYFYIGKGKNDRYKHILKEIATFEKNPRKYKGKKYKMLKDKFGIEYEFLYTNITEKEATILESYEIMIKMKEKHPLLNVILPNAIMENDEIYDYRNKYFYENDEDVGLKNKLCKCNFPKINDNTKNAAKSGNAEERPDAGCEIKRWKAAAEMSSFFIVPPDISKADKPREFEGSALNSRQAASLSSKKIANCEYASPQSLTGIVHFFEISFTLI